MRPAGGARCVERYGAAVNDVGPRGIVDALPHKAAGRPANIRAAERFTGAVSKVIQAEWYEMARASLSL